jgi:hypothetical protein
MADKEMIEEKNRRSFRTGEGCTESSGRIRLQRVVKTRTHEEIEQNERGG